jgi:hypothetical protein
MSDIVIDLIVNGRVRFGALASGVCSIFFPVGTVAAAGVAAVAALAVVGRGEDEVRAFVVVVFRGELGFA